MKIGKMGVVNALMEVRKNCKASLIQAKAFIDDCDQEQKTPYDEDTKIFQQIYCGHVHKHSDGSGRGIDMDGCYVGRQVASATIPILQKQIATVEEDLKRLGVELE